MTNGDYFRQANDDELAELLASLCIGILTQVGIDATPKQIVAEIESFKKYLKQEVVKGDYLN